MSGTHNIRPPRLERFGPKTLTGLLRSHKNAQDVQLLFQQIAAQWRDYTMQGAALSERPKLTYGVVLPMADGDTTFGYFCGAETKPASGLGTLQIPQIYCAVFQHNGHVSGIRAFIHRIFSKVLPMAGLELAPFTPGVPEFIERYDQSFDRDSATGLIDILVPIKE